MNCQPVISLAGKERECGDEGGECGNLHIWSRAHVLNHVVRKGLFPLHLAITSSAPIERSISIHVEIEDRTPSSLIDNNTLG
jgi:hypothetical protein